MSHGIKKKIKKQSKVPFLIRCKMSHVYKKRGRSDCVGITILIFFWHPSLISASAEISLWGQEDLVEFFFKKRKKNNILFLWSIITISPSIQSSQMLSRKNTLSFSAYLCIGYYQTLDPFPVIKTSKSQNSLQMVSLFKFIAEYVPSFF